jgi:hypothetical protein
MTSRRFGWLICVGCFTVALALPVPSLAQYKEIDHIGNQFAKEFMKARPEATIVAVADLRDTDGTNHDQGHYFSLILTSAINIHMKNGFAVADHAGFDAALKNRAISAQVLTTPKAMTELAGKVNVSAVVTGDFRQDQKDYTLHLSAVRISDGSVLYSTDTKFRHDEYLDSLAKPFPPPEITELVKLPAPPPPNEKVKARAPICERCLFPQYTVAARSAKLQGTVAFDVVIGVEGEVVALRPTKVLGLGLDEAAYDVITKQWRMKPGTTMEGKPIVTLVPIEVTFRLY